MMRVSELMTPAPIQVSGETPLPTCALRMDHLGIRHLPVIRGDGRLVGVITDAAVHRHGTVWGSEFVCYEQEETLTAFDLGETAEVVARADDDLLPVLRRLARTRQDCVVVVDDHHHPIGVLTEHDLLKVVLHVVPGTLTIDRLPARAVISFRHTEPAAVGLDTMIRNHIRHLPITGPDGGLVGVVSYRDLVAADVTRQTVTLDDVRSTDVFTATPGDTLVDCASRMLDFHVGCLPVVAHGRVVRMVTRRDLIEAAATGLEEEALFEDTDSPMETA